ncbi:hypothetical protein [uncultured Parabacteroides sp.]|uniref:hypothetical protein n=1 Tax=uncultured Parabacteroides sp. TaxID=512312 RepID=UPI00261C93AA|nr:hypothetical protein [uncultured Parabacteroides sp.]
MLCTKSLYRCSLPAQWRSSSCSSLTCGKSSRSVFHCARSSSAAAGCKTHFNAPKPLYAVKASRCCGVSTVDGAKAIRRAAMFASRCFLLLYAMQFDVGLDESGEFQ